MKPSDRILEIMRANRVNYDNAPTVLHYKISELRAEMNGLIQYLDEQYEAEKIAKCSYDHEKSPLPCSCGFK